MNFLSQRKISMNARHVFQWCAVGTLLALGFSFGLNKTLLAQPATPAPTAPAVAEDGVQVLTRGPVHEAFAETVTFDPEPGIVVPKEPPAAIEEVPPEQRLEGANVAWIPGYWGWDDERNDFLWVSGIWRDLPPGRQWVPGYWGKSEQGFQWTSGYWADARMSDVEYLPEPPATVEAGPNVAAPSPDDTWLPGCWVWQNTRYVWRPGFWAAAQPDWAWVPAHYVWAPRGYVFVDGYWDYSIGRRGVLFAPVYFSAGVYGRPGFSYSPTTVIDMGVFTNYLFLRPRYQHYYFGDYYAANYRGEGILPWFSFQANRVGYDPIYAQERWQHRQDSGWERRLEADFNNRRDHEDLRPPRTWAAQGLLNASDATSRAGLPRVALLLDDVRRNNSPQRFQSVDQTERQQFNQHAQDVERYRQERQRLERNATGAPAEPYTKVVGPNRVKLPGSPIVGKPGDALGKDHAPPKAYVAPKLDPNVAAKQRVNRAAELLRTQSQPQPKAERQAPQPKVEHQAPPPAKVERQAPPPKAERQTPPPRDNAPAGQKQDPHKDMEKN
jgi:hypothetical protein